MCSPDKLPCRHEPGYQTPRQRSFWLNPLILFLSFLHIPYWVMGVLGRARSDGFNLKPGFEPNYPTARVRKTPDYLTNIFSALHMPVYIACCIYYSITFLLQVLLRPDKVCANKFLSDEEFCKVIENSLFTTMLRKQDHPDPKTGATIYHMGGEPEIPDIVKSGYALPGLHVASYYIQFSIPARATGASRLKLDWIRLNDVTTFTPDDHPLAWKWAKVFAMNAIKTYVVYFYHPLIHFPADTLNAFVRSTLPEEHVVRQLLTPHMDHQLEISDCVLDGGMSICEPEKWWVPYAALYLSRENIGRIWSRHSLPKKEFFVRKYQISEDFVYGRWLKAYQGVVDAYVKKVMSHVDAQDPHIKLLVERLSTVIPDFPKMEGNDITPLTDYLSNFVFGCSIWHSGDHYSMQDLCSNTAWPHRLRVPPPASPHAAPAYDGVRSACTLFDWYRHYMADAVIVRFTPNPLRDTTLLASDYPFPPNSKTLRAYVEEFKSALVKTEEKLAQRGENIIPLQEVLRSIEF